MVSQIAPVEFAPRVSAPPTPDVQRSGTAVNNGVRVTIGNNNSNNDPLVMHTASRAMPVYGSMHTPSLNDSLYVPTTPPSHPPFYCCCAYTFARPAID